MATAAKQPELVTEPEERNLPAVTQSSTVDMLEMIERLAANPSVDVVKLEKIIELKERVMRYDAKAAFDAAFAEMQPKLPAIDEKGRILNRDGSVRNNYARLEDIQAAVKPILAEFGFGIRHKTEWPDEKKGIIRIRGILTHKYGHSEESIFEAPADKSDFRTDVQAEGSTISYGKRYTTLDVLNLETRGKDDDGRKGGRPQPPDGYDDWTLALGHEAQNGLPALERMFHAAKPEYRGYLTQHDADVYKKLRERARTGKPATS